MNILLLGSGGREHALAWKLASSTLTDRLFCAPGNAGIAQEAECVALDITDHAAVVAFCKANTIDFVVVGPEGPLVAGVVDDLEAAGLKTFGPTKSAARLEGSKGSRISTSSTREPWRSSRHCLALTTTSQMPPTNSQRPSTRMGIGREPLRAAQPAYPQMGGSWRFCRS